MSAPGATATPFSATAFAQAIVVHDITKIYVTEERGAVSALSGATFSVNVGEFVSLVGPSGCGKSTLLSLIAGLSTPTRGTIEVEGRVVRGAQTGVGLVFQSDVLLEWRTALDNVLLQAEARGMKRKQSAAAARTLLESMGLAGFEKAFPTELSGGMRQRVAICRALLHEPDILLMDEPFGALDALTREQLGIDLAHLWDTKHRTALFITHDIGEAVFLSDRVVVMTPRPGKIETIIDIALPRPRRASMRALPEYVEAVAKIRALFLSEGVLHE